MGFTLSSRFSPRRPGPGLAEFCFDLWGDLTEARSAWHLDGTLLSSESNTLGLLDVLEGGSWRGQTRSTTSIGTLAGFGLSFLALVYASTLPMHLLPGSGMKKSTDWVHEVDYHLTGSSLLCSGWCLIVPVSCKTQRIRRVATAKGMIATSTERGEARAEHDMLHQVSLLQHICPATCGRVQWGCWGQVV